MKVFVASSFLNKEKTRRLQRQLRDAGHTITYDWTIHEGSNNYKILMREAKHDMQGVLDAEVLVILWPGRFGTSGELGAAIAADKPIYVLGCSKADRNNWLYLNHANVEHLCSIKMLLAKLKRRKQA